MARFDKELGQAKTASMKTDTTEHPLVKFKLYQVPLHKNDLLEQAVQEMSDAEIIEQFQSPWSFQIVNVGKKSVAPY